MANKKLRGEMPTPARNVQTSPGGAGSIPTPGRNKPGPMSQGAKVGNSGMEFRNGQGSSISGGPLHYQGSKLETGIGEGSGTRPGPMRHPFADQPVNYSGSKAETGIGEGSGNNPGPRPNTTGL